MPIDCSDLLAPPSSEEETAARARLEAARAAAIPTVAANLPPIARAVVIGAGTMGRGIALALAAAGVSVRLVDTDPDGVTRGLAAIDATLDRMVARGRLGASEAAARRARVAPAGALSRTAPADPVPVDPVPVDLVIEAIPEDLDLKRRLFADLSFLVGPETILATNTSTLDVDAIAAAAIDPSRVIGTHFLLPAEVTPLLEIVPGRATAPAVLARVRGLAARMDKLAVVAGNRDGFIGNRMFDEVLRQAAFLVEEGALPHEVDAAAEAWGHAIGPFRTLDRIGNDVPWAARRARAERRPDLVAAHVDDRLCETGRFGVKSGRGWYLWEGGRPRVDPAIAAFVETVSRDLGLARRTISPGEIVGRLALAAAFEGARLIEAGVAERESDVDLVAVVGYGFPAARGGPLAWARRRGRDRLEDLAASFAGGHGDPAFWRLPALVAVREDRAVARQNMNDEHHSPCEPFI